VEGLLSLTHIGKGIAGAICKMVATGQ